MLGVPVHRSSTGASVAPCSSRPPRRARGARVLPQAPADSRLAPRLEAIYGLCWAVDVLQNAAALVHLEHPLGVNGFAYRRGEIRRSAAANLADLTRVGSLPKARSGPPAVRELWRTGAASAQAVRMGLVDQGVDGCCAGQERHHRPGERLVRCRRFGAAEHAAAARGVPGTKPWKTWSATCCSPPTTSPPTT